MPTKELIFVNDRLNWRQVPHLMSLGVCAIGGELSLASSAALWLAWCNGGALLDGDDLALMALVPLLSALFTFASLGRLSLWFCVWMLGAGRQRRVSRGEFLDFVS